MRNSPISAARNAMVLRSPGVKMPHPPNAPVKTERSWRGTPPEGVGKCRRVWRSSKKSAAGLRGNEGADMQCGDGPPARTARYALIGLHVSSCREDNEAYAPGQALVGRQGSVAREHDTGEECTHRNGHPKGWPSITHGEVGFTACLSAYTA